MMIELYHLRATYCRANRCWQANNLKSCARICNLLTESLAAFVAISENHDRELAQLKQLVWFLKIKCLAEDYHINESFLLNEDDIDSDAQIKTFNASSTKTTVGSSSKNARPMTTQATVATRRMMTNDTRGGQKTGILTGRMPTGGTTSRRRLSGNTTSSYRPLNTSLTATQTAFSRSTRPLLKYATCSYLSKPIYQYLYNAQNITNICPDYRQCLEYLYLVRSTRRQQNNMGAKSDSEQKHDQTKSLYDIDRDSSTHETSNLGCYWSLCFAICYFHLKMHTRAEEYLKVCSTIDKRYLDPYLWLMKVYLRLCQPLKVLETCDKGIVNSCHAILYNWRARFHSIMGNQQAAHQSLRDSLHCSPTNIEALANVGHYSFYGDKLELANKCFERIYQLSMNTGSSGCNEASDSLLSNVTNGSSAELLNNMALCQLQCGNYSKVMPLFQRAFLNSPSKEVTSNIWYNISFVPLSFGSKHLAMACLQLALKNDVQNEEATNNLGVLKYESLINDQLHYANKQESWCETNSSRTNSDQSELVNSSNQRQLQTQFDDAETYFGARKANATNLDSIYDAQPEMLYNMAIVKRKRGQMLSSRSYCYAYLQYDQNNHTIRNILSEIRELISHDS